MKTLKTAPKDQDIFTHEGPTARVLSGLTWFFVLISTVTVTAAWYIFLEDHIATLGAWKWPAIAIMGACFAFPVEVMIFELSKYFWRSQIKGYHRGRHQGQFITASVLLFLGLTYSVFMSQKATRSAMIEAAPAARQIDTRNIDTEYRNALRLAGETFGDNAETIEKRFAETAKSVSLKYETKIDSLAKEYEIWSAKGDRYRRKVDNISRAMLAFQSMKAGELAELAKQKAAQTETIQAAKQEAETKAADLRNRNTDIAATETIAGNAGRNKFAQVFGVIVSTVAAMAVLFVFLLARFLELFYERAGVKRVVFLDNTDMNDSVFLEALRYPAVYVSRHLGAWVQRRYQALPKPLPPLRPDTVYDPEGVKQEVVKQEEARRPTVSRHDTPPNLVPVSYPSAVPVAAKQPAFEWEVKQPETLFETMFQPVSPSAVSVELEVTKQPEPKQPEVIETPAEFDLRTVAKQLENARGKVRSYRSRIAAFEEANRGVQLTPKQSETAARQQDGLKRAVQEAARLEAQLKS
jgi:hypothetical protein